HQPCAFFFFSYDLNAMVKIKVVEEGNHLY
ncbi:hypothetical protein VCEM1536_003185B, partial [Vibrio cholerae O1 str. EM-1536]